MRSGPGSCAFFAVEESIGRDSSPDLHSPLEATVVRVLLVDDDDTTDAHLRPILGAERAPRFRLDRVPVAQAATQRLTNEHDVILLNLVTSSMSGLAAFTLLQAQAQDVPILVMAPAAQENLALKAVQLGADDYLITDQVYDTLLIRALRHALERRRTERERRAAEEALRASEQRYRSIFEQSRDAILITDAFRVIVEANSAAVELFGYPLAELRGKPITSLYEASDASALLLQGLRQPQSTRELEIRMRRKDGGPLCCLLSVAERLDWAGKVCGYQAIAHDITARKFAEERLLHSAFHDTLTGLPNRALFNDRLELALARWRRNEERSCAVLFLDLDRFKVINDSLGHYAGDAFLRQIADALRSCMREEDTVARMGGDEFAVLLDDVTDVSDAIHAAERIQERLAGAFDLEGQPTFTSASIGIALPDEHNYHSDELLRNADIAMYRAKAAGPARHEVFTPIMHSSTVDLRRLESDLHHAVEHEEFVLHYQPIFALPGRSIIGFEALLRWLHPKRGLLLPHEFMPLAEETGLILPIGWWALREACREAARMPPEPGGRTTAPFVAVNLSRRQLAEPGLPHRVRNVLAETGLSPERLHVEITENLLISNGQSASATIAALRRHGVHICVDDFGTRYSSLTYLHSYGIDGLKIDRSFIGRVNTSRDCAEIVHSIVTLADRLGITTVAGGIETREQLAHVERLGASSGQGFLFSRPLQADPVSPLLSRFGTELVGRPVD
jgi:diguanylate cyclase (GGDEF)-like protein/PAS domain S-box-containing protein